MSPVLRIAAVAVLSAALSAPPAFAAGGSADTTSRRRATASEAFVPMPGLTATVTHDYRARGVLHVEAGVEIPDGRTRARAERLMPRLRAHCAEALRAYAGDQYRYGAVPDADRISVMLQAAVDDVLGEPGAGDIILGMVIIHEGEG